MSKSDEYRHAFRHLKSADIDSYLCAHSGLPGPRGNLELVQVVADEGDEALFVHLLTYTPDVAPTGSPREFLAVCGAVGIGKLLAGGDMRWISSLRQLASDPRWRVREGVAMALQRYGDANMPALIAVMAEWSTGSCLEQRAAAAALCEPRLLVNGEQALEVLAILDAITFSMTQAADRKSDAFKVLRKAMGYCWSVAVAALPREGKRRMEKWFTTADKDVIWVMRENLKKNRLARMDSQWVEKWK